MGFFIYRSAEFDRTRLSVIHLDLLKTAIYARILIPLCIVKKLIKFQPSSVSQRNILSDKSLRIGFVGGGAASILAAHTLKQKGFENTVIFEANERIGGKALDTDFNGQTVPLGAVQTGVHYQDFMRLMREEGLELRRHMPVKVLKYGDNKNSHKIIKLREEYWPKTKKIQLIKEAVKLSHLSRSLAVSQNYNYKGLDAQYDLPFATWCQQRGLEEVQRWYEQYITAYGFGDLSEIPAAYAMTYLKTPYILGYYMSTGSQIRMPSKGYQHFFEKLGEKLDVRTNSRVVKVKRNSNGVIFRLQNGNEFEFDIVFLSTPLDCLEDIIEQSTEEKFIAENTTYKPYRVITAEVSGLKKGIYLLPENNNISRDGHISLISHELGAGTDLATFYIPERAKTSTRTELQVTRQFKEDLRELGINLIRIHHNVLWENYFPHFTQPSKIYPVLNSIQGVNNTFYVGSMCKFDIVHSIYEHVLKLVEEHFDGERPTELGTTLKNFLLWKSAI